MIKALKRAHPFVVFTYFAGLFLMVSFSRHPWMTGVQMICLCLLYFYHNQSLKKFFPFIVLIVIVAVTNPLFVQRGRTILYADTHVRITKEALLYGIHYGCVLVNLLLVFSIFNQYIKKEQWIYLSGRFFPKLGVITSMAFGLIPRYQNHAFSFIYMGEKRLDSYRGDCDFDDIKSLGIHPLLFQIFLLSDDHYASISDERSVVDACDDSSVFITMHVEGEF